MSEQDELEVLLQNGLTPDERTKFEQWEDGFISDFWTQRFVPFLLDQEKAAKEACAYVDDEKEWRHIQGKLAFIRALLGMRDYVRTNYGQVAEARLEELEASLDEQVHEDYV